MNPLQVMQQAREMQERLQRQMAEIRVEASAGGGMVTVVMNGQKHVLSVRIDPAVVVPADVEMLQDLVAAAVNDAGRRVDEEMKKSLGGMMAGLGLPGLPGLS